MKKRVLFVLVAGLCAAGILLAQSEWEGTTAMGRYGEFPSSGLYGASDSFPRNTLVKVTNIENGETVKVLIVDRLDDPGLFLLLSRDAAAQVGIKDDQVVRTRVELADNSNRLAIQNDDQPYHPDPDINPGAGQELSFLDRYKETAPAEAPAPEKPASPAPEAAVTVAPPADETAAGAEPEPLLENAAPEKAGEPEVSEPALPAPAVIAQVTAEPEPKAEEQPIEEAPVVTGPVAEDLYAREPGPEALRAPLAEPELQERVASERSVDNLYGAEAPQGPEDFPVTDLPPTPAAAEREAAIAEQFPLPQPPYDGGKEEFAAAVPRLIEEQRPEEPPAEVAAAPASPSAAPATEPEGEVSIELEPAGPRPPEKPAQEESPGASVATKPALAAPAAVPSASGGDIPVAPRLDPKYHYLQLGVFSTPGSAKSTAARFSGTYPVLVLNQDNTLYKVLVGPLSPDESGALLLNFRAQGFRDAFIRKGY